MDLLLQSKSCNSWVQSNMKTKITTVFLSLFILIGITGCGGSAQMAQNSLDKSSDLNGQVRDAYFVKAWGLNRALATESREKNVAQAKLKVAKGELDADKALDFLSEAMRKDETVLTSNFGFLSMLQVAGERADQAADVADSYIEASKPMWKHIFGSARDGIKQVRNEYKAWEPIIGDAKNFIVNLVNSLKPAPKVPVHD